MSASREKKKRQLQEPVIAKKNEPVEKKTPAWKVALYWAIGVLFVICFAVVMLFNSNFFAKHSTAATVGSHKISPAMMNIYYTSDYSNFVNQYGDYISYFLDTNTPLAEQTYDEETGESWAEYFLSSAEESLTWAYTMYDKAVAEGYTLSDIEQNTIKAYIDSFKEAAASAGFSSANGYLGAYYGSGVTTKTYEEFLKVQFLAADYYNDKVASFEFNESEKAAFYAAHADQYDTVSLEYSYVKGSPDEKTETGEDGETVVIEPTEEETAAAMDEARALANKLAEGGVPAMSEYDLRTVKDYSPNYLAYVLPAEATEWAYEAGRTDADIKVFESGQALYVVHFVSRNDHNYNTKNIRMIEVTPETVEDVLDADGNKDVSATDEKQEAAFEAARKEAKKIFEEWEDGDMTEDSFKALAEKYSNDENGGLVNDVADNVYSQEVADWLYDAKRSAGDCELFTESETSNTPYIVYFLGDGNNYQQVLVETDIVTEAYNNWYEEAAAAYPVTRQSGIRYVDTH